MALPSTHPLAQTLVQDLARSKVFLCTAESCTGGLISNLITDVSGSSEVFWGAVIAYDNASKSSLLGVSHQDLIAHGAVSPEVAKAMAAGGLDQMRRAIVDRKPELLLCIATTGIAGPTGATTSKPVGLCYLGLCSLELSGDVTALRSVEYRKIRSPAGYDRLENKVFFARCALDWVASFLSDRSGRA